MEQEFDDIGEYTDLEPVFHGTMNEATLLRSALVARGFAAYIPSENMKTTDPFYTGANALTLTVVVPAEVAEEAKTAIAEMRAESDVTPEEEEREGRRSRARWLVALVLLVLVPTVLAWWAGLLFG